MAILRESFNTPNTSALGPDLTWTDLVNNLGVENNQARPQFDSASSARSRAEHDLDSDDHYAQMVVTRHDDVKNVILHVRYSDSADSGYAIIAQTGTGNTYRLFRVTSGSFVQIGTTVTDTIPPAPYTLRLTIEGDTLRGSVNGLTVVEATDSTFTTGRRTGFGLQRTAANDFCTADDFEAADVDVRPELVEAMIAGADLSLRFDEPVTPVNLPTLNSTHGSVSATLVSGSGTNTLLYSLSRSVDSFETVTLDLEAGDVVDDDMNPNVAVTGFAVTVQAAPITALLAGLVAHWEMEGIGDAIDSAGDNDLTETAGLYEIAYVGKNAPNAPAVTDSSDQDNDGTILGGTPYSPPAWTEDTVDINRFYLAFPSLGGESTSGTDIDAPRVEVAGFTETFPAPGFFFADWVRTTAQKCLFTIANNVTGGIRVEIDAGLRVDVLTSLGRTRSDSNNTVDSGDWTHIAVWLPIDSTGSIYINGTEVSGYLDQDTLTGSSFGNPLGKAVLGLREATNTFRNTITNVAFDQTGIIVANADRTADVPSLADPDTFPATIGSITGKVGLARSFESSLVTHFAIPDNADLSMGDVRFTGSCWVRFTSLSTMEIVSKYETTGNQREYRLIINNTGSGEVFRFIVSPDGTTTVGSVDASRIGPVQTGVWYHAVFSHQTGRNLVTIEPNALEDKVSHSTGVFDGTSNFNLGARGNTDPVSFLDGDLDEVSIWKRNLTRVERRRLFNNDLGIAFSDFTPLGTFPGLMTAPTTSRAWLIRDDAKRIGDWTLIGYVETTQKLAAYNHTTEQWTYVTLGSFTEEDDHNQPAFTQRSDGRFVAVYSEHAENNFVRVRVSTNPNDPTSWEAETTVATPNASTYPQPRFNGSTLEIFVRSISGARFDWYILRADEDGNDLSDTTLLWARDPDETVARPYAMQALAANGDWHFFAGPRSGSDTPLEDRNDQFYHFYLSSADNMFYQTDGTLIGSSAPGSNHSLATLMVSKVGQNVSLWQGDVGFTSQGRPRMAYQQFDFTDPTPGRPAEHRLLEWDGTQWVDSLISDENRELAPFGNGYTGSEALHPVDDNIVAVGNWDGNRHRIKIMRRISDGNWVEIQDIAEGFRPRWVENYVNGDGPSLVWMDGATDEYTHWDGMFDTFGIGVGQFTTPPDQICVNNLQARKPSVVLSKVLCQ